MRRLERVAESIIGTVKRYVGDRMDLLERSTALRIEERIAQIQLPPKGEKGDPGEPGAQGERGEPGAPGQGGEPGKDGRDGADGKDGQDGAPGKDGEPGPQGPPGKDGEPGIDGKDGLDGKDGAPGKDGQDGAKGEAGRDGKDGADGRDALAIVPLDGIDHTRTYPRGTWAMHRGGTFCSIRATDPFSLPLEPDTLARAGWACAMDGIHAQLDEPLDDGRTIRRVTEWASGKRATVDLATKAVIYRRIWKPEATYQAGDLVTWAGSVWHCSVDQTSEQPGGGRPDWVLMVKRGDPGKMGPSAPPADRKPVKVGG